MGRSTFGDPMAPGSTSSPERRAFFMFDLAGLAGDGLSPSVLAEGDLDGLALAGLHAFEVGLDSRVVGVGLGANHRADFAGQFLVAGKRTDGCEDIEAGIPRAAVDLAKVGDGGGEADKGQAQGQQCQGKAAPEPSRHRGDHRMASPAEKIGR